MKFPTMLFPTMDNSYHRRLEGVRPMMGQTVVPQWPFTYKSCAQRDENCSQWGRNRSSPSSWYISVHNQNSKKPNGTHVSGALQRYNLQVTSSCSHALVSKYLSIDAVWS